MIRNLFLCCLGGPINKNGKRAIRGPVRSSFKKRTFSVFGGTLNFSCPSASPAFEGSEGMSIKSVAGSVSNLRRFNNNVMVNDDWRQSVLFMRQWGFFGQRFSRAVGEAVISIQVLGKLREEQGTDLSLFHPRAFEGVVAEFLNERYGFRCRKGEDPLYQAPVNWRAVTVGHVSGALFEVHDVEQGIRYGCPMYKLMFPVTDSSLVQITMMPRVPWSRDRKKYDISPITEFVSEIINSFEFTLSPESKRSWDSVSETCESMALCDNFAPLKWPIKPDQPDNSNNQFQLFEGRGS